VEALNAPLPVARTAAQIASWVRGESDADLELFPRPCFDGNDHLHRLHGRLSAAGVPI